MSAFPKFIEKEDAVILKISKTESLYLRDKVPTAHITIVNRQSSHKKYYTDETPKIVKTISDYRRKLVRKDDSD